MTVSLVCYFYTETLEYIQKGFREGWKNLARHLESCSHPVYQCLCITSLILHSCPSRTFAKVDTKVTLTQCYFNKVNTVGNFQALDGVQCGGDTT